MISDKIIRFHLYPQIYPSFIELSLNCGASNEFIETKKSGMAESQVNISQGNLKLTPIPLPPLAEQERIVAKVGKLMDTCVALEAEVAKSRAETDRLMQTILKEAFETKKPETE
jgi:type I restriction enzyme S subunit